MTPSAVAPNGVCPGGAGDQRAEYGVREIAPALETGGNPRSPKPALLGRRASAPPCVTYSGNATLALSLDASSSLQHSPIKMDLTSYGFAAIKEYPCP